MRLSFIAIFFFKETHIFMPSIVFVLINKRNQFFVKTSTGIPSSTKFNIKNQKNKLSKKKLLSAFLGYIEEPGVLEKVENNFFSCMH